MNKTFTLVLVAFFAIFLGSQITEGFFLVPFWKSLPKAEFYNYYAAFGPTISTFYSLLTIIAVLIPVSISIYCYIKKSLALYYAVVSSIFALLIIVIFYVYFKGVNQQFYEAILNTNQLKSVLQTWEYLHWARVFLEIVSLIFLIKSVAILNQKISIHS